MSFSAPLIWFLLVDSSGQPYKKTSAAKVSVSSSADVDDFRDAVKKKDKDDGDAAVLSPFKSSQLTVYKNKTAFGNRNAPLKEKVLYYTKGRKSRSKKTLSLLVWEAQRRKLSLSSLPCHQLAIQNSSNLSKKSRP